MFQCDFMSFRI